MISSSLVAPLAEIEWCVPPGRNKLPAWLDLIWQHHFSDMPRVNSVFIDYCYPWKSRLGLIRLSSDGLITFIGINTLLRLQPVPACVLITTIAHEMVHYSHGFGSPLPRIFKYPHANGVVDKALEQRALGAQLRLCNEWINQYWYQFYEEQRASGWAGINGSKHP